MIIDYKKNVNVITLLYCLNSDHYFSKSVSGLKRVSPITMNLIKIFKLKIWLFEEALVWFHKISAGNSGNTFWPPGLLIGIYGAMTANIIQEKFVKSKNDIHSFIYVLSNELTMW